ncbi:hypothetical protein PP713_14145 [Mycobacterium sp. CSUR Q5927]|nr:hypothetical protein [Mycobacterium sp. CSUR Q5927]
MSEGSPVIDKTQQFLNALPAYVRPTAAAILAGAGGAQLVALIAEYGPVDAATIVVAIFTAVGGAAAGLFGWLSARK